MAKAYITRNEEMILLTIIRLKDNAYLVTILDLLNERTKKSWTIGNLFVSLEKLEQTGNIYSTVSNPTGKRGGKAIKYYSVSKRGITALKTIRSAQDDLWDGLYDSVFSN